MGGRQKFRGVLEPDGTRLHWTVIRVPFDPAVVWPKRNRLRVKGGIRALEGRAGAARPREHGFYTSLFRMRDGGYVLLVNRHMQKGAGVTLGSMADVWLEPDTEERPVWTPPELERLLREDRGLKKWHGKLSPSMRKAIADSVADPKSAAARLKRAELWAERMLLAMEGERVLPPILEAAFLRQGKAREGWRAMTPAQRRGHLLGIFNYQSPESRAKRAQKALEAAVKAAGRREGEGRGVRG